MYVCMHVCTVCSYACMVVCLSTPTRVKLYKPKAGCIMRIEGKREPVLYLCIGLKVGGSMYLRIEGKREPVLYLYIGLKVGGSMYQSKLQVYV